MPLRALKKSAKYNTLIDVFDTFVFAVISDRGASIADRKLPVKPVLTEVKGWLAAAISQTHSLRTIIAQFNHVISCDIIYLMRFSKCNFEIAVYLQSS